MFDKYKHVYVFNIAISESVILSYPTSGNLLKNVSGYVNGFSSNIEDNFVQNPSYFKISDANYNYNSNITYGFRVKFDKAISGEMAFSSTQSG